MNIIVLIIFGLIMSVSLGSFMAMIITSGMDDGIPRIIVSIIISLIIGFGLVFFLNACHDHEEEKWNNGICTTCNTEWHFQSAARGRQSTTYYYVCENGHILETNYLFHK